MMIAMTLENVAAVILLIVLVGSILGSTVIFLAGSGSRQQEFDAGYASYGGNRPADWPSRQNGAQAYLSADIETGRSGARWPSPLTVLLAAGLAYGGASVGLFAYHSPWPVGTDLRHLAATLHCDLADRVGLASARAGTPGYHVRNDRDRNGIACETYDPVVGLVPPGQEQASALSPPQPVTPDSAIDAVVSASE